MDYKDYYRILEVDKKASSKEIKQAYRRLARQYHPDVNGGSKQAEERFKEINEAYEVLSDADKRCKYDDMGANWNKYGSQRQGGFNRGWYGHDPSGSSQGGYRTMTEEEMKDLFGSSAGFSDFFYTFFGDPGSRSGGNRYPSQKGRDIEHVLEISLQEAYTGTVRIIQLTDTDAKTRRIEAKIPRGVDNGSRIKLKGQGGPGINGSAGDLFLIIKIKPDATFKRKGADLFTGVKVPLTDTILGGEARVPTICGDVMLNIPPETANGRVFKLKGRGMPHMTSGSSNGDLYAEVSVELPCSLSDEEEYLFKQLAGIRGASGGTR